MARQRSASGPMAAQAQNLYLCQFSYTAKAWNDLLKAKAGVRDRIKAVEKLVEALGGCFPQITIPCADPPKMREKFGTFGDHDVVTLIAFPNDTAASAFAMAISAGGAVSSFKTTRLMPWGQMMDAMQLAAQSRNQYLALK
jgi:GYD domain